MSNTEVSTTQPVTINTTNETAQLKISPDRAVQARDIYYECCKQLAQHISENGDTFGEVNFEKSILRLKLATSCCLKEEKTSILKMINI